MRQNLAANAEQQAPISSFSWDDIEALTRALAGRIQADGVPEILVSLQRGGLIPGVLLSHRLAVPELFALPVRRTISDAAYAAKQTPHLLLLEQLSLIAGKDVVLVDDIVGSGETLQAARSALVAYGPTRLRTAVYLVNLAHWESVQLSPPEHELTYIGRAIRAWAIFPWERQWDQTVLSERSAIS